MQRIKLKQQLVLLIGLLYFSVAVNAEVTNLNMVVINDGASPFDADSNPGNDAGPQNDIVRTHDQLRYRLAITTNGGDSDVIITIDLPVVPAAVNGFTLPAQIVGEPLATWQQVPPQCIGASSVINNNGTTLVCDLGDLPNATNLSFEPNAMVSGMAPNGADIVLASGASGSGLAMASSSDTNPPLLANYFDFDEISPLPVLSTQISAAPRFDLIFASESLSGFPGSTIHNQVAALSGFPGDGQGPDGFVSSYGILIAAHRLLGSEMLNPEQPLVMIQDVLGFLDGMPGDVEVVTWPGMPLSLGMGCALSANNFTVGPLASGTDSTDPRFVARGGICTEDQPTGPGGGITVMLEDFDSSLTHFPTSQNGGNFNPAANNRFYITANHLVLWSPLTSLNPVGTPTPLLTSMEFDPANLPRSISGQVNIEPDTSNNGLDTEFNRIENVADVAAFAPIIAPPTGAGRDFRVPSTPLVNFAGAGQLFTQRVGAFNTGSETVDFLLCEKFDNARLQVTNGSAFGGLHSFTGDPVGVNDFIQNGTLEWGVQVGNGNGLVMDSWGEYSNQAPAADGGEELTNTLLPAGSLFMDSTCPNADPSGNTAGAPMAYFTSLDAVLSNGFSLGQVTMLRLSSGTSFAALRILFAPQLQLRETFAYDVTDALLLSGSDPFPGSISYSAGELIPGGTHVPASWFTSFVGVTTQNNFRSDVFEVISSTEGGSRIVVVDQQAELNGGPLVGGDSIAVGQGLTFELTPNYTTPNVPAPGNVTITQVLPPGIGFVADLQAPSQAVVFSNIPEPGYTTVEWTYSNVTPLAGNQGDAAGNLTPIRFSASVAPSRNGLVLANNDQIVSWTASAATPGDLFDDCIYDAGSVGNTTADFEDDPGFGDCEKADSFVFNVSAPPGLQVFSEALNPSIESNQLLSFRLNWTAIGSGAPDDLQAVYVLPFNGDGGGTTNRDPASSITGTYTVTALAAANDLLGETHTLFVTDVVAASIDADPLAANNDNPGGAGSIWCALSDIGTAGCPASLAVITGILIEQPSSLTTGELYSVELSLLPSGNSANDIYANNTTAGSPSDPFAITLQSTTVSSTIASNGMLGDRVWLDFNADGIQDAGEPGISGVSLTLHDASTGDPVTDGGGIALTDTTDGNGNYLFTDLLSTVSFGANYEARVNAGTLPGGVTASFDLDGTGTANVASNITLGISQNRDDADFGYTQSAGIQVNKTVVGNAAPFGWAFTLFSNVTGCMVPVITPNPQFTADGSGGPVTFNGLPTNSSTTGVTCTYELTEAPQAGYQLNTNASDPLTGIAVTAGQTTIVNVQNDQVADLSVTKVDNIDPITAGDSLIYTITVNNAGPGDALNVVSTETLPLGVSVVSSSGCNNDPGGVPVCNLGNIPAGGSASYSVTVTVGAAAVGTLTNLVTVSSDSPDTDTSNNTALENTDLDTEADLSIVISDDVNPVIPGNEVTYTVVVNNAGPSDVPDILASAQLPEGTTLVSTSGCDQAIGIPVCTLGALTVGNQASYTVTVTTDPSASNGDVITKLGSVLSNTITDPDNSNNSASEITTYADPSADLSISKFDDVDPVSAGGVLGYTITVNNAGPSDAQGVVATDMLPLEVANAQTVGCVEDTNGAPDCTLGMIPAGGSQNYTLIVDVASDFSGTLANDVSVVSDTADPNASNNHDSEQTLVELTSDLAITISSGSVFGDILGDPITYMITVTNNGPSDVNGARVEDTPPETELGNISWTCTAMAGSSCANASGSGPLDELLDLAAGSSVLIELTAEIITTDESADVVNTAIIRTPVGVTDPVLNNNTATDIDAIGFFVDGFEQQEN